MSFYQQFVYTIELHVYAYSHSRCHAITFDLSDFMKSGLDFMTQSMYHCQFTLSDSNTTYHATVCYMCMYRRIVGAKVSEGKHTKL